MITIIIAIIIIIRGVKGKVGGSSKRSGKTMECQKSSDNTSHNQSSWYTEKIL